MDEIALIQAAKQGDLDAFNRLVLAYQDQVYAQAYRMMGELDAAEDATQEAFISAFRSIQSYRGGSFRAWLLRIVTNASYDELRRRQRRPTTPLEPVDSEEEEIESPHWLADPSESPEDQAERMELDQAIQNCLKVLPPEFRAVVVLVDVQGFDYFEAAEVIRKPVGTVKSRLSRARLRLRDCLKGWWELIPAQFRLVNEGKP
jgi:RNA polymerase sigma-70 factor (ECF subfamily)